MRPNCPIKELNQKFSIDNYLSCSASERKKFRKELLKNVAELRKRFIVVSMRQEDVLETGLMKKNKTAIALGILQEKTSEAGYDELFHFRDTIRILNKQLFEELFGGKNMFYNLSDEVVAYDPNYFQFVLAENIEELRRALKQSERQ